MRGTKTMATENKSNPAAQLEPRQRGFPQHVAFPKDLHTKNQENKYHAQND